MIEINDILDPSFSGCSSVISGTVSFASFFRSYLSSTREKFFSIPYERPENVFTLPGESDEDAAERISGGTLVSVGIPSSFGSAGSVDWQSNPTYNGYKEWTWQLSRHNDIKLLAHEYLLTGKKKYAEAAEALLSSWIKTCPCPDRTVPGDGTKTWRTIECGIRMGANWPYIIYSFYNVFSDSMLTDIAISLYEHGERLEHNHMHGNWLLMEMNGLSHIAVLFPFLKKAEHWKTFSLEMMENESIRQFYPDGFQYELTTCYHEVAVNNYQRLLEMLKVFGIAIPEKLYSILEKAAEVNVLIMESDGCLPDINDGSSTEVRSIIEPKLRLFNTPLLNWAVTREGERPSFSSVALLYSGFFVFRSGWNEDDVYGLFDSAPFGRGHQHEDKLSFIVSNGTHRVITEGCCYAYDDSPMRRYTLSSYSHNVLLVDGMGQNRRKSYEWHDEDIRKLSGIRYGISDSVDWAEGEYSGPYGDDEHLPALWKRTIYFVKKHECLNSPVFIVVDRISAETEHEYTLLWHIDSERKAIEKDKAIYSDVSAFFAANGNLSVVKGSMNPVAGYIATGKEQGMYKAVDELQYRVSASSCRLVTVIGFSGDIAGVEATGSVGSDDVLLKLRGKDLVLDERKLKDSAE